MRSIVIAVVMFSSGCALFFDDGGKRPPRCLDEATDEIAEPAGLRDPEQLTCTSFGPGCDPECGPCPEQTSLAPIPSWGVCGSVCEGMDETSCAAAAECRVVRDARCAIDGNCETDFIGCFPTDTFIDMTVPCLSIHDGWACSRNPTCSALHTRASCPSPFHPACVQPFGLCVPEGTSPGRCHDPIICAAPGPACPANTTPGVANGCFTGACIPLALCENSI
jgi:hypothetical protein